MRTGRKLLRTAAIVAVVLVALLGIREAFFGYTAYFVIVPGAKVFTDGRPSAGWLHRGGKGQLLIVTRTASGRRESYWVNRPEEKAGSVRACGDWVAPRLPLIAIGHANPPCMFIEGALIEDSSPSPRPPVFGSRFVEFTAEDGARVRAVW